MTVKMKISVERIILGDLSTNTYIVTDNESGECAVIDPAVDSEFLKAKIIGKNVKYILLTHGHFDHITGTKSIKDLTDARVVIERLDDPFLKDMQLNLFAVEYPYEIQPEVSADIVADDGTVLYLGNVRFEVMHTPGHTPGGCCYVFTDDKIMFSGDTLFKLSAGRTDFEGGNAREILRSLEKIASIEGDMTVYPGHGDATTLEYERKNNRYMRRRYASFNK